MNEHPPASGSDGSQKELAILVRKMWVRWLLVCAAGPMLASALLVFGEKFSAVRAVTVHILPIILILGIILIFVVSIQLGQAVQNKKA